MTIQVLLCRPDGTQEQTTRQVPEDYFVPVPSEEESFAIMQQLAEKKARTLLGAGLFAVKLVPAGTSDEIRRCRPRCRQ